MTATIDNAVALQIHIIHIVYYRQIIYRFKGKEQAEIAGVASNFG